MLHKKRGVIFGLIEDTNIGDRILTEATKYLYSLIYHDWDYEIIDLKGRNPNKKAEMVLSLSLFEKCYIIIGKSIRKLLYCFDKKSWRIFDYYFWKKGKSGEINTYTFFKNKLAGIDLIIFAGGGIIEYEHYNCYLYIQIITKISEEYKIPIVYNAVGFNGSFDINDFRCRILYDSLNSKYVKNITVHEFPDKMRKFLSANRVVPQVCDPAVWSADVFNIKRHDAIPLIGINVIRPEIFSEFGYNIKALDLLELYICIIDKLAKKFKWQLFSNGYRNDYTFGKCILRKLKKKEKEFLIEMPRNSIAFLSQLSNYRGCICARMHASICAYSLKIPTVSLSWNEKINSFYDVIGYPERCFSAADFSADKIVSGMIQALEEQYDISSYNAFRETIKNSIKNMDGCII